MTRECDKSQSSKCDTGLIPAPGHFDSWHNLFWRPRVRLEVSYLEIRRESCFEI